jgi:hypothetical protein
MFTFPLLPIRIHSFRLPLLVRNLTEDPAESLARNAPLESCPNLPLDATPFTCTCAVELPAFTITVCPLT